MQEKILLIVLDGLGDRPLRELEFQTPLEAAEKPNLNKLARKGITGLMDSIGVGVMPGSDTAHFALLGFNPERVYFGRGPLEALGVNFPLQKKDVALRVNFATIDNDGIIIDRRAGRINSVVELCKKLDGITINKVKFFLKPLTNHRAVLVMRGNALSSEISGNDPKMVGIKPLKITALNSSKSAEFTASILSKFIKKANLALQASQFNKERIAQNLLPANFLLVRGAGMLQSIESFEKKFKLKACCVAGGFLYKGIAKALGMSVLEVKGATGKPDTDLNAKIEHAVNALREFDFVFLHIKATDSFSEDGDFFGKKEFIERIDKACKQLLELENTVIAITADHSTPCVLKKHSADPVPLLIFGPNIRVDPVTNFSEKSCAHGALGRIKGIELVPELINLAGRSIIYGA